MTVLTLCLAALLWAFYTMTASSAATHGRMGGPLAAAGAGLLALSALLPNWVDVFRFLDRPLNFAPATDTMLFALRTYVGVSLDIGRAPWVIGTLLLVVGIAVSGRVSKRTNAATFASR